MKKIILLLALFFIALPSNAFENYLMMTDHRVTNMKISNLDVLTVEPIVISPDCKKHTLMIIPKKVGSAKLTFCKGKKRMRMTVKVYCNKTCIKKVGGVHLVPMDLPPELVK